MRREILCVTYFARGERSKTKKIYEHFLAMIKDADVQIEELDLTRDIPDLFTPERLAAYLDRNYGAQALDGQRQGLMAKMDRMTAQFKKADLVVVAFPMNNFSQPAIVKAYFDSIVLKGETWDANDQGWVGLMKGKKALILISSGGEYQGASLGFEHATSLTRSLFQFMAFDEVVAVTAPGLNLYPQKQDEILKKAKDEVTAVCERWFPQS